MFDIINIKLRYFAKFKTKEFKNYMNIWTILLKVKLYTYIM